MPSTYPCPKCGEYHYHKSHSRGNVEKLRKRFLRQRIYRCHVCGHREWERQKSISSTITPRLLLTYLAVGVFASLVGFLAKFMIQ